MNQLSRLEFFGLQGWVPQMWAAELMKKVNCWTTVTRRKPARRIIPRGRDVMNARGTTTRAFPSMRPG